MTKPAAEPGSAAGTAEASPDLPVPATFNLADIWEATAPRVPDRIAVVCGDVRRTYAELDERATRLAHWMIDRGVQPGQHVGLYLTNCPEYFEAMLGCYKARAVPINVNYRYVAGELRHLFADADLVGVLVMPEFAERLAEVAPDLPMLRWSLELGEPYEAALAASSDALDFGPRRSDDHYVIYTGGTTGLPKGVVWTHENAFYACIGGGDPSRQTGGVTEPAELVDKIMDTPIVFLPVAPLMHAAGQWTSLSWLFAGGTVVLLPGSLDPVRVWRTVGEEKVNLLTVVGDPVVRPLVDAWIAEGPFDVSSLFSIGSGGAPLSPALREQLMSLLPGVIVSDGFGSSETGAQGAQRLEVVDHSGESTRFTPYPSTTVIDEATRRPVEPGSGVIGRVSLTGRIPIGYYNAPEKTAETFVEIDGQRWVMTGDMATIEEDGTVRLFGRGSGCINTGGEKVFPEEVEAVLKAHPSVYDALVVGVDDQRWGQAVAAIVAPVEGTTPTLDELAEHCRASLAGYKVPRSLVLVDRVQRSPAGKADYRWAQQVATEG
ncbi:MAG TPA: acyl-CoA synthetase [Acidimicrobiales bacterium]|nr:acyl-CoA synthetase [Acidimicrobiales bacterium]